MLINNRELTKISTYFTVVIKSNTKATPELMKYCERNNIQLLDESYNLGFGDNNNYIYSYLKNSKQITDCDYFLVINPDITIELEKLKELYRNILELDADIFTINLYKDSKYRIMEPSIKKFPTLLGPFRGLFNKNSRKDAYDKTKITSPVIIDWAAGSFLLFKKNSYEELCGFNDKFFMYFEDVDICRRAKLKKMHLMYLPHIDAIHAGAFKNRNIFSRHFIWYIRSYLRYHFL
ncbi:glycosyltransferase family protein [Photobacterium leiognathi]|uniref:glycosyltransferase family 2 protein n=1 Tax=Photobacterium leiognathi TaxID=553611 RepID=UPI002982A1DC|nr:glycosyltransferase family 2 protein [Photobacterium leiognathi]